MGFYAIWPMFLVLALLFTLADTRLFRAADDPAGMAAWNRVVPLDGLRGFLALAVFFHHAAIYHGVLVNQVWRESPSLFYTVLGQAAVALFFMITGFLFWSRLIKRDAPVNWMQLYIGRLFRIAPVYWLAIAIMMLVVLARRGFALQEPYTRVAKETAGWLSLGYWSGPFNADDNARDILYQRPKNMTQGGFLF